MKTPYPERPIQANNENDSVSEYIASLMQLASRQEQGTTSSPEDNLFRLKNFLKAKLYPDKRHTIHVAGSKGKGSTVHFIDGILRAASVSTYRFTSPDIHSVRERIAINGQPISQRNFATLFNVLNSDASTSDWSYFQLLTAMGWLEALEQSADWQVLEVGLGGRLDPTNAVHSKEVAVITPLDLEHTEILGGTFDAIAREKLAIADSNCHLIIGAQSAHALKAINNHINASEITVSHVTDECMLQIHDYDLSGQTITVQTPEHLYARLHFPIIAKHQAENLMTAIRSSEVAWRKVYGRQIPAEVVHKGIGHIQLAGRVEVISREPTIVLDGLHTPLAALRFKETVAELGIDKSVIWVIGFLAGKQSEAIIRELVRPDDDVIVTAPPGPRALDVNITYEIASRYSNKTSIDPSVKDAVQTALGMANKDSSIFIVGSLYTVASARAYLLGIPDDTDQGLR
jgi:dihydrofolate synthase/folylpolyglutamate synthase